MSALNPADPVPLHVQAEAALRQLIQADAYRDGRLLPDEMSLATQLGISRGTVRAAILRLVDEGILERRSGVGTRVVSQPATSAISAWQSLTREMTSKGIVVESYETGVGKHIASTAASQALRIKAGTFALRLDRLRGWGNTPVLHSRSWFHPRLKLKGEEDYSKPLYEVIEETTGVVAYCAREELAAVPADALMAKKLKVRKGSPLLLRKHTVMDRAQKPFEYAEVHYVSERYALTIDSQRSKG
ncbi:GntR family transcriptional regulator [Aeoliella sp. ICT_H6.2]|uniref:GntR family transcriptional regulator n=1 Tax=Aeoliella straminimaris TaxID=2954799 RepID=A0A9X2FGZ1_9BACT|nr:GntR family transcriptional regulator [Aeoliella straminimaris]MCO6046369.1 GntR family transcriptional regulator [Aeoliella straminimaris]